jgi:hypothetical protein
MLASSSVVRVAGLEMSSGWLESDSERGRRATCARVVLKAIRRISTDSSGL